jgi:cytochrome c553
VNATAPRRPLRELAALVATLGLVGSASANNALARNHSVHDDAAAIGAAIYRTGIQPSGQPLQAERDGGIQLSGATAACINCHRRSGLGMKEGRRTIPPIAGSYLFHARADSADGMDLPFVDGMRPERDPYTEVTLARAIRAGIAADGTPLSYLMPRYTLDDSAMHALIAHLKTLSPGAVPGVTDTVLHFATIITPDADPVKRQGMLEVLEKFFADKNRYTRALSPRLRSSRRMMFQVNRHWELHVWQLTGPANTWQAQLQAKLAAQPVFAVLSGLGGRTWQPVHRFCEQEALPCLFPNLELPVVAEGDFDNLYLSQGVLLEARLMAYQLQELQASKQVHRVVQVYREADVGAAAARALASSLAGNELTVVDRGLNAERKLASALRDIAPEDVLVLWLRPDDIERLGAPPSAVSQVLISGQMAGLEQAPLPAAWRPFTSMTYPFDLPQQRRVRVDFPLGWFRIRQIPVVAQQVQVDTWLVCGIVSDTVNHMVDAFVRDYLVERVEEMLEHRAVTGYYPRLALAPGQRFASKGGYLVRFAEPVGTHVVADSDWIVP